MNGEKIGALLGSSAESCEQLMHRGEPIALFHAQPGGVYEAGGSAANGSHDGQRRQQIGTAGNINFRVAGTGQLPVQLGDDHVSLRGAGIEPV